MSDFFLDVLNMSITASYVAIAVMIVRLFLKKAPKIFSYALWAVVLFRLLCPFTFESPLSFIFAKNGTMMQGIITSTNREMTTNTAEKANLFQPTMPVDSGFVQTNINPVEIAIEIGAFIWLAGIIVFLTVAISSYLRLQRKLSTATLVRKNIFETDRITTSFVFGLLKPKIYLPVGLSGRELHYILKHEQTHIKRYDHIIKPIAFFALILHWFNPIVWLAYFLMVKDMEMSCDENVMKQSHDDIRVNYSYSLLSLSTKRSGLFSLLAFGERNIKSRIKNILHYRKPSFWMTSVFSIVVIIVAVGLLANPKSMNGSIGKADHLLNYKTEYVGDASKVGNILSLLDFPNNVDYQSFELSTATTPYAITVHLLINTEAINSNAEMPVRTFLQKNAIQLFALIYNVDIIIFKLNDSTFEFTRDWANASIGKDVRTYSESEADFAVLIQLSEDFQTREEIITLVESFGSKLQTVSLMGPNVSKSIRENYSAYVTQQLLDQWLADPTTAPGRLLSSPWPERIEVETMTKLANDKYEVKGNIIEMTSVEKVNGGIAAKVPITIVVVKENDSWLISDFEQN